MHLFKVKLNVLKQYFTISQSWPKLLSTQVESEKISRMSIETALNMNAEVQNV